MQSFGEYFMSNKNARKKNNKEAVAHLPPPPPAIIQTVDARPSNSPANYYQQKNAFQITPDFVKYIASVENSVRSGFKNNRWYPHKSVEGGLDTIAYGHKLQPGENFNTGLTEQQALDLLKQDLNKAVVIAKRIVDNQHGSGSWEKLPNSKKEMLVDFAFNGALAKFPKFIAGVVHNNPQEIATQYKRFTGTKELRDRNTRFATRYNIS